MPYMRTVKTTSGATAVQVVWSSQRGSRKIEHLGSAHGEAELEALKAAVQQRIAAGQPELDLGLEPAGGEPLPMCGTSPPSVPTSTTSSAPPIFKSLTELATYLDP